MEKKVWVYLVLLSLQYGTQPLLSKRFVPRDAIVTSLVLSCEVAKALCAALLLLMLKSRGREPWRWSLSLSLSSSLSASALPAAIYAVQNSLLQISYKNLDSLTFAILNQTKLLFTALFTFLLLGHRHSRPQIFALALLLLAAVLLTLGEGKASSKASDATANNPNPLLLGFLPLLAASVLSGLASALCQWASQVKRHASFLMTIEMSLIGSCCLLASLPHSPDGLAIRTLGFFHAWTPWTLLPVLLNALGGILVGLVTAHAGGVRKGFVIVSALLVTALLQFLFDGKPPSLYCLLALPLVISSIFIYQKYPYLPPPTPTKKKDD